MPLLPEWEEPAAFPCDASRLRALVDAHHAFIWRTLRRLGVPERDRRTLVIGMLVIGMIVLTSRGIPAWRRWDSQQRATAADAW